MAEHINRLVAELCACGQLEAVVYMPSIASFRARSAAVDSVGVLKKVPTTTQATLTRAPVAGPASRIRGFAAPLLFARAIRLSLLIWPLGRAEPGDLMARPVFSHLAELLLTSCTGIRCSPPRPSSLA